MYCLISKHALALVCFLKAPLGSIIVVLLTQAAIIEAGMLADKKRACNACWQ